MDRYKYEIVGLEGGTTSDDQNTTTMATTTTTVPNPHKDALKGILLLALLLICFFMSILPFLLKRLATHSSPESRRSKYAYIFTLLSVFGGGVFLATCLLDLLPDAVKDVHDALVMMNKTVTPDSYTLLFEMSQFPISEFLVGMGFFVVLFAEQFVMWMKERGCFNASEPSSTELGDDSPPSVTQSDHLVPDPVTTSRRRSTARSDKSKRMRDRSRSAPAPRSTRGGIPGRLPTLTDADAGFFTTSDRHTPGRRVSSDSASSFEAASDPIPVDPVTEIAVISNSPIPTPSGAQHDHEHNEHGDAAGHDHDLHFDPGSHSTVRALLLVGALSLHSIFEGLALGLAESSEEALSLFAALVIHKSLISFSVGLRLVQSALSTLAIWLCCLVFCIGAPIGGAFGIALEETFKGATGTMLSGCLTGVACGTFLYITCFEILPHELNDGRYRAQKMVALLFGYFLIVVLVGVMPG